MSVARGPEKICRHCGLSAASAGDYCCYGCELAAQIAAEGKQRQSELYGVITFSLLLSMIVMMLSLFLFAEDVYGAGAEAGLGWMRRVYKVASALLSTPVVILLGVPLAKRAIASLRERTLSMDLLVLTGAVAAYGLSIAAVLRNKGGVYFDSATSALVLTTLGRYLEASARARASRVIAPSLKLSGAPVQVSTAEGAPFERLGPSAIEAGMRLRIEAEEVLPVDARVLEGDVELTLGVLTGVAAPVVRNVGDEVPAGAVPVSSAMVCEALRPARESTLERLSALARSLKERPSRLQRLGDVFASALVPLVALLALGSFAFTAVRASFEPAVITSLAVVLAACPCTYGVATPLVLWLALRKALEKGVCIRNAAALEELSEVKAVAFDKTGTLTHPELALLGAELGEGAERSQILGAVLGLEAGKRHPIARALAAWAAEQGAEQRSFVDTRVLVGRGVSGRDTLGHTWLLGSPAHLREQGVAGLEPHEGSPDARAALACDGVLLARFLVGEALRPEAEAALGALRRDGIRALMLTGDTAGGAAGIASLLDMEAHAALSPVDKLEKLEALGKSVAMVGDGLNDAPALAGTGPSFAMHGGSDLAKGMAQVTLLRPDLRLVPWTLALSRRAMQVGWQNLVASTVYNVFFLLLAATGALRPVWAGLSMLTSSLLTLASSLRVSAVSGPEGEVPEQPGREIPGFEGELHAPPRAPEKLPGAAGAEA
jgi:heavy metal translocating P-type ATPase